MNEISAITGYSKNISEAIAEIRIKELIGNDPLVHSQLKNSIEQFKDTIQPILTKKQKRGNGGNYSMIDVKVGDLNTKIKSFSKFSSLDDIGKGGSLSPAEVKQFVENENIALLKPEDKRVFETSKIDNQDALFDTKAKLLENIAGKLGDNYDVKGSIDLYTQLSPCASCRGVISQFMDRYPNIKINLNYDKQYHN
ncbi:hypothetical protein COM13_09615 [Bacillus pseudomycoides]|uniref:Deaminase n=2 Tax=Bacillus pseudomycoides TaxID=64104 RepID=A0ABD6SXC8_9BACI|nr:MULTISPECIES: deaminase domain-containing protein [Bacillus]EEM08270.1 hypothetical protein bmyco0003_49820 [Bacillus pseudomycoides]EEM16370.1 hypothetical protein bpmyx0001_27590 [Bacillus pseudomycoides DSM 12442]KFN15829.1 of deaminases family protein [Bacillus pseudomycoides]MBD5799342.1 hypothetical protein [Bacillus pseudomycoides]MCX2824464.1 hypothetical protein [Bacillus sp. DHT2]